MVNVIGKLYGLNVFEHDYDRWKNHEECNGLIGYGVAFQFANFLRWNGISEDSVESVFGNISGARDGNRYDIHDDYLIDEDRQLYFSFLYVVNGNLWATIYDKANNTWYGDIEIPNI